MTQISILGCGWLGLPLAKALQKKGFRIKGSTTTFEKLNILDSEGIEAYQIQLTNEEILGPIASFLEDSEILIVDIPPKLRNQSEENFVKKIKNVLIAIKKSSIKKVLFVSSTSVFADHTSWKKSIAEDDIPNPDTESGQQLWTCEKLFFEQNTFTTTIVRFGGLIGAQRHPVYMLSGKKNIVNPLAPINLIHLDDCIEILIQIIEQNAWSELIHGVAPFHPSRKEYYQNVAKELHLSQPEFNENIESVGKCITSLKLNSILNYKFKKPFLK
ncbi:Rossmann-fold NAD(P)-binding domain-containing protein [Flavobacterium aciduliphilum]|uniref:Nucleoside-diphosphate-sugar epimerase n=1 Tax=Flavobacterium aciduliphilum TaxID=1101402 RepID=A0A328YF50_9FLAO|nr:SDR family NAD(P)-dependent oxidoreductase [Flavobacterium aciduliphilum]RAR72628.1 nucleoside-diphosphate-sugar epimerase [Flavobacterium aciduliphilum]